MQKKIHCSSFLFHSVFLKIDFNLYLKIWGAYCPFYEILSFSYVPINVWTYLYFRSAFLQQRDCFASLKLVCFVFAWFFCFFFRFYWFFLLAVNRIVVLCFTGVCRGWNIWKNCVRHAFNRLNINNIITIPKSK